MSIHSAKGLEFDLVLLTGMEEGVFPHMRVLDDKDRSGFDEELRLAYVALTRARKRLVLSHVQRRFLWGTTRENEPSRFLKVLPGHALVRFGGASKPTPARTRPVQPSWSAQANSRAAQAREWDDDDDDDDDDDIELDPEYAPTRKPKPSLPSTRIEPEYDPLDALAHDDLPDTASEASDEPVVVYDNAPTTRVYVGMRVRHSKWGVGSVIGWSGRGEQMKLELRFPSGSRTIMARFCEVIG
jgi:DNA helicase-2/ATP-dependent DNA helicase PcrA